MLPSFISPVTEVTRGQPLVFGPAGLHVGKWPWGLCSVLALCLFFCNSFTPLATAESRVKQDSLPMCRMFARGQETWLRPRFDSE